MSFQSPSPTSEDTPAVIAVSACLLGEPCRYDGSASPCEAVKKLAERPEVEIVPICPETAGTLPCPRPPAEIVASIKNDRRIVVDAAGNDVTEAFEAGAWATLCLVQERGCTHAILKTKSPSCGIGKVYDGTFSGTLISGDGIAARLLMDAGIDCINEHALEELGEQSLFSH